MGWDRAASDNPYCYLQAAYGFDWDLSHGETRRYPRTGNLNLDRIFGNDRCYSASATEMRTAIFDADIGID